MEADTSHLRLDEGTVIFPPSPQTDAGSAWTPAAEGDLVVAVRVASSRDRETTVEQKKLKLFACGVGVSTKEVIAAKTFLYSKIWPV